MTLREVATSEDTSPRLETVINLLLLAGTAASSLRGSVQSSHDQGQAAMVVAALDEALVELRLYVADPSPGSRRIGS